MGSRSTWEAFLAGQEEQVRKETISTQILPIIVEEAATPAMFKHCFTDILKAHHFTNPGETPWVTADQRLFALMKLTQWSFRETHGGNKLFAVLGALHVEKADWTTVGQVEDGSGTTGILADAYVTTIGVAESCLSCSRISRTMYVNTVNTITYYSERSSLCCSLYDLFAQVIWICTSAV